MQKIKITTLKKVESSNLDLIGFDGDKTFIQFKNGKLYEYPNTTLEEFNSLLHADSVGKEFFKSYKKKEEFTLLENTILEEKRRLMLDEVNDEINFYKGNEAAVRAFKLFKAELIKNSKAKKPLADEKIAENYFNALKNERDEYMKVGKNAKGICYELLLIERFVPVKPEQLTDEAVQKAVNTYVGSKGFTVKDMGSIMRIMKTTLGDENGQAIARFVKEALSAS